MFQSLLGFLMRCDHAATRFTAVDSFVSIPAGFSDALRLLAREMEQQRSCVSIPAGFSDALRLLGMGLLFENVEIGFNPCWVF